MSADVAVGVDLQTGALGRHAFASALSRAVAEAKKGTAPLSLLYVDADDFREHEDCHGSDATGVLLGWLAEKISEVINGRGPIGRIDEDAFAVILPAIGLTEATRIGETLRMRVAAARHEDENGTFRLTISVGVAALRRHEPWGNLLEAAENACLKAKQGGRDRTVSR